MTKTTDQFEALFTWDTALIDVRAPVEFANGSFPSAVNLPILNDQERHEIGVIYKEKGPQSARDSGFRMVSGSIKKSRVDAWCKLIKQHEQPALYCFRGGLRSEIACNWLKDVGYEIPRIIGGYKALRQFLLNKLELPNLDLMVIAGRTGTGKTELLHKLKGGIDLEGAAGHRGSAFGRHIIEQPAQIDFENHIAVALVKAKHQGLNTIYMEDEGRLIGRIHLPGPIQTQLQSAPLVLLEASLEERVERIFNEYIIEQWLEYQNWFNGTALAEFSRYLLTAMDAIKKRLGPGLHKQLRQDMEQALNKQQEGEFSTHKVWIEGLLSHYYDPMYNYQINKKADRIIFRGDKQEILQWLQSQQNNPRIDSTGP
ncbi:MAG: tRNA 2-selenouridine(34) synthase MnmH [Gammaproteobacteria bacterium]|jgi:tRNA 2-selenouridine synthase|nr:tRNA 2-selenouridine(34) synthase MnmH [Gammaproteobacteria bacterium]MBT5203376.1 tRNA 2-selenouridine(34) synthase MnmH [Gammaproteobacteria bacterium]MBT5604190.1 tRNA 2-selenouridine(34) synthase MnmH [Gammaproteobacteria bacterium]MBT6247312.1 tRNA 2-selenouridine(34) synthase MnmH [Gammaproteobacteria bacterium]